jgi:hypothetical protein
MRFIFAAAVIVPLLAVPALAADETPPAVVPAASPAAVVPDGATALCRDGTYTMSHTYSGACSSHHGVVKWYKHI